MINYPFVSKFAWQLDTFVIENRKNIIVPVNNEAETFSVSYPHYPFVNNGSFQKTSIPPPQRK